MSKELGKKWEQVFNDEDETAEVLHNTLFKIFKGLDSYNDTFK